MKGRGAEDGQGVLMGGWEGMQAGSWLHREFLAHTSESRNMLDWSDHLGLRKWVCVCVLCPALRTPVANNTCQTTCSTTSGYPPAQSISVKPPVSVCIPPVGVCRCRQWQAQLEQLPPITNVGCLALSSGGLAAGLGRVLLDALVAVTSQLVLAGRQAAHGVLEELQGCARWVGRGGCQAGEGRVNG